MYTTGPTLEVIARAIDVCALKQAVYSANIANVNVDGYKRLEVQFDAQAMRAEASAGAVPAQQAQVVATNSSVELDTEVAAMARNALRWQTLISAYESSTSVMKLAVHEGKGV
ncbi:MAG TPA: flagellar basal body protein [Steroidobacteraceae bacterium]|nr:flagellar basal body protein [Steroidobacteraceae bacterium]